MANNFRTGMGKLSNKEASAIVAPLAAIIKKYEQVHGASPNERKIVDNYIAAMQGNGKNLKWVEPNGTQHANWQALLGGLNDFTPTTIIVAD